MDDAAALIAAQELLHGGWRDRMVFLMHYVRWIERIEAGMRDEAMRIIEGHASDLTAFDQRAANMTRVIERFRADLAAVVGARGQS